MGASEAGTGNCSRVQLRHNRTIAVCGPGCRLEQPVKQLLQFTLRGILRNGFKWGNFSPAQVDIHLIRLFYRIIRASASINIPAGHHTAVHLHQRRDLPGAPFAAVTAAGVEMAAGRRRGGVGDFSLQDHPVDLHIRVGLGHCGEQCLRIGVEGVCKQFIGFTELHHPAQVHDHDPVGNMAHHTQGMGDKQIWTYRSVPWGVTKLSKMAVR